MLMFPVRNPVDLRMFYAALENTLKRFLIDDAREDVPTPYIILGNV